MNSLERQKRLTKLLAMAQTTRMAIWALSDAATAEEEAGDTDLMVGELTEADGLLQDASEVLAKSLRREIVDP
jgi:hypothetical protein